MSINQDQHPNFRDKDGKLYLVRCFACGGKRGTENYAMCVSAGVCYRCGWGSEGYEPPIETYSPHEMESEKPA